MASRITLEQKLDYATLKPHLRGAFKSAEVFRVELHGGILLYKLTQVGAVSSRGEIAMDPTTGFATPWWFSYESLMVTDAHLGANVVRGVAEVAVNVNRLGVGFYEYLRCRGAVCMDWNVMTHLLLIELRRTVIGMMGTCSGQPTYYKGHLRRDHGEENISFIGGEQQFYIPGLRPVDVSIRGFGAVS